MAHAKTVTPLTFLAISLGQKLADMASVVTSFVGSIETAQSQAAQFEMMNNMTDVELADRYQINRDQIVAHIFKEYRS